ncbi:LapA family protein [Streptomyces enissocaesilis]|uniref:Lipopolysaccharide assembly protein A domain-containing protein n=1 Tax=Streptomyces enissocaesilis TaxID=332589 RepID=A0ABP6JPW0_9ACTN
MSQEEAKTPSGRAADRGRTGRRIALTPNRITAAVLAALAIVLIAENTRDIEIRLLVPVVTMPLYLALLLMFVIGGLCGALLLRSRGK